MKVYDIILDNDNDIDIRDGDLFVEESTYQHIEHIMLSDKGTFKQFPQMGANINSKKLGNVSSSYLKEIRLNLENDNLRVDNVRYKDNQLEIQAEYE